MRAVAAEAEQGSTFATNQSSSVSGTATLNSTVEMFADAQKLGSAKADASGQWVLPVTGLPAGK